MRNQLLYIVLLDYKGYLKKNTLLGKLERKVEIFQYEVVTTILNNFFFLHKGKENVNEKKQNIVLNDQGYQQSAIRNDSVSQSLKLLI